MTKQSAGAKNKPSEPQQKKKCFVMMPISDCEPYPEGHFKRVYEHLIKPAIIESNFEPLRADDVAATNYIILDIIHEIITSDLALCDLSGRNPNVMYELGIRHAFGKPTILIKDDLTLRVFDIQGLRSTEYDSSLRIDSAKIDILAIKEAIKDTLNRSDNGRDINSIVQILQIQAATLPEPRNVSEDTQVILSAIKDLANRNANNEKNISRY